MTTKRPMLLGLFGLENVDATNPVIQTREKLLSAGRPLLVDAQTEGAVLPDVGLDHVLDLIVAIAEIVGPEEHRRLILRLALRGLFEYSVGAGAQPPGR